MCIKTPSSLTISASTTYLGTSSSTIVPALPPLTHQQQYHCASTTSPHPPAAEPLCQHYLPSPTSSSTIVSALHDLTHQQPNHCASTTSPHPLAAVPLCQHYLPSPTSSSTIVQHYLHLTHQQQSHCASQHYYPMDRQALY